MSVHDVTHSDVRVALERLEALVEELRERNATNLARLQAFELGAEVLPAGPSLALIKGGRDAG